MRHDEHNFQSDLPRSTHNPETGAAICKCKGADFLGCPVHDPSFKEKEKIHGKPSGMVEPIFAPSPRYVGRVTLDEFERELTQLINKHSLENLCNTPDFVLAKDLRLHLEMLAGTIKERELWYGN